MASKFEKIKRVVEEEKTKKVRNEARRAHLKEEEQRIYEQIKEEAGKEIKTVEEMEAFCTQMKADITSDIDKMAEVLKAEGIEI
ncbi:hypothetical protein AAXE64_27295 [Priestia megaterium]|uniref:hypothetical protein n=1 Tax=Priestia megaterium TaxID=1404 RepID=UPI003D070C4D